MPSSSLVAYIFGIAVYAGVTIPSLRTIVIPVPDVDTREDRIEAMRILSAGNTIIMILLGAILALQVRIPTRFDCSLSGRMLIKGTLSLGG